MHNIFRSTQLLSVLVSVLFVCPLCAMKNNQKLQVSTIADLDRKLFCVIKEQNTPMIEKYLAEINTLATPEQPLRLDLSLSSATFHENTPLVEKLLNIPGFQLKPHDIKSAIKQNHASILQLFIKYKLVDPQVSLLGLISQDLAKGFQEKRIDLVQRYHGREIPEQKDTPLNYAARLKKYDILEVLAPLYSDQELTAALSLFKGKTLYVDLDDIDSDDEDDTGIKDTAEPSGPSDVYPIATGSTMPTNANGESQQLESITDTLLANNSWLRWGIGSVAVGTAALIVRRFLLPK